MATRKAANSRTVMAIDIGGTHVKAQLSTGPEIRKVVSGPTMTPQDMVEAVKDMTADWTVDVISMGFPGVVVHHSIVHEPTNLAPGWVGFKFDKAFGNPVRILNDAAMQALGSYEGGRMLFLGLGTGLGSAMMVDGVLIPMELAHLPRKKKTYEQYVGVLALQKMGKKRWRMEVADVVDELSAALEPDYVVIGGGNAKKLDELPPNCRLGANTNAFIGGFRLWDDTSKK